MKSLSILLIALLFSAPSQAQFEIFDHANESMELQCVNSGNAEITVTMSVYSPPPAEFVGWVLEREVWGACDIAPVQVSEIIPFEVGVVEYQINDTPEYPEFGTRYFASAVDAAGNRQFITPSNRYATNVLKSCLTGYVYWGTVRSISNGERAIIEPCPGRCLSEMSMWDLGEPLFLDLASLVGQAVVVSAPSVLNGLHGGIWFGDPWFVFPRPEACQSVVSNPASSWGSLKSLYR